MVGISTQVKSQLVCLLWQFKFYHKLQKTLRPHTITVTNSSNQIANRRTEVSLWCRDNTLTLHTNSTGQATLKLSSITVSKQTWLELILLAQLYSWNPVLGSIQEMMFGSALLVVCICILYVGTSKKKRFQEREKNAIKKIKDEKGVTKNNL